MRLFTDNLRWLSLCLGLLLPLMGQAQQGDANLFPPKPNPAVFVHDYSGWLAPQERAALEQKLRAYNDSTSTQVVVMIRPDIGDYDKSSYAFELGDRWGIGRKDKDNGILMLIKTEAPERGIFIATGYGAEGALPDITAGRIIRETMAPYFRQQQYYRGIDAGLNDIIRAMRGEYRNDETDQAGDGDAAVLIILFLLMALMLFYAYRKAKRGAMYTDRGTQRGPVRRSAMPGQRGTDYGSRGGGWIIGGGPWVGGGGGDFGGGGSSWGDSFGGGDFGGGGAGGDW
jgi:uncharacterized protein